MTWTTDKPTVPGWYWWRKESDDDWEIVQIIKHSKTDWPLIRFMAINHPTSLFLYSGEWAGPIPFPLVPPGAARELEKL